MSQGINRSKRLRTCVHALLIRSLVVRLCTARQKSPPFWLYFKRNQKEANHLRGYVEKHPMQDPSSLAEPSPCTARKDLLETSQNQRRPKCGWGMPLRLPLAQ